MDLKTNLPTVKLFIGHDIPPAAFNFLEFAWKVDKLDGAVRVCTIQVSTVVTASYLLGLSKTMNDIHWTNHYNVRPRLLKIDVQVKTQNVPNPSKEPWSPNNQVRAAHILSSKTNKNEVNIQMGGMYNKKRKVSRTAANLPKAQPLQKNLKNSRSQCSVTK